jgi:D-beta-D-heptose 7-phosphate kinase / D-beta-D-heptose 1-phosphate adenosyltransferase
MKKHLPNFSEASVLVIGDIMLDRYWFGDTLRISPEAPVPVVKVRQQDERPGGAGNVALNMAALGVKVMLLGITGKDDAARSLIQQLKSSDVTHDILSLDNIPTITKLRIISRHQQLIRLDFEERFPQFNPKALIDTYKKHLAHTNLVILSDYNKGTLACAQDLIQIAQSANIPVLVDPKGTQFNIYRNATVLTPNLKEFEAVVGDCANEQEIVQKGRELLANLNIDNLLLTRGERGMTLIQKDEEEIYLPAHAKEVFDVTGAGDTVIALLGAVLASGSDLPHAMYLANLAASLVVAKLGAATVSVPELEVALRDTSITLTGVLTEEQLFTAISEARLRGKKIVFTNGCFDILHAGHATYLQQAKQLGDYLIVAVNDDASVAQLKGPARPINKVEQRMAVLASLGVVDWVTSFSDDTPKRLLKQLQPDILVKGGDYTIDQVVGSEIVLAYGGEVRVLGIVKNLSTSSIINRVIENHGTNLSCLR